MSDIVSIKAIQDSISHWERMISWVETQRPEGTPNSGLMRCVISEAWYGNDCALCKKYADDICADCPLKKMTGAVCSEDTSPWSYVTMSNTWGEWLIGANTLLIRLQEAKEKESKT